jgi:hypothetical protein
LDIVVHHINQAVQHQQDDDSEDETVFEVNYELKKEGFKVTNKDNGADFEFSETDNVEAAKPTSSTTPAPKPSGSAKFRKGHRRAWSMPNAKDKAVLVVADDSINVYSFELAFITVFKNSIIFIFRKMDNKSVMLFDIVFIHID